MVDIQSISSMQNPRVKAVQRLRRRRDRQDRGLFIAEGKREIGRAVRAGVRLVEVYCCIEMDGGLSGWIEGLLGESGKADVLSVTPGLMKAMAYRENPEGVLAVMRTPVGGMDGLEDPVRVSEVGELWLLGIGIEKPGNLGAMVRCAAAAGCCGVLVADGDAEPYNPNCLRASTGGVFELPVVADTTEVVLGYLRDRGVRLVIAVPGVADCYTGSDLTGPVAVVVGAEDRGVPDGWRADSEHVLGDQAVQEVSIPMAGGGVDSLNTSVAAAVVLFEAVRQRTCGVD